MSQHAATGTTSAARDVNGGRFDFDDGGTYCGGWEDGKAHGHGVCTGPKGQGEYAGSWHYGFEVSGVYTWPSGSSYEGHWQNGKRHGLGVETRGRWIYRGEWTQGFKGRYGVRQSNVSSAKYEGTWANGLQDGYGSETYADGGTYQGQWLRGMRHGYGVRSSAPFGIASHCKQLNQQRRASFSSVNIDGQDEANGLAVPSDREIIDTRGGFVLRSKSEDIPQRRRSLVERTGMKTFVQGLKLKKQRSTGDLDRKGASIRSTGSTTSWMSSESGYTGASIVSEDSNQSFVIEDELLDASVTETYMGEWKNDRRCGFGISERSDGLKYEGEWYNNRKYGYGVTIQKDGVREEGKYKNNILITSNQKRHLFLMRSAKFRERIDSALNAAQRASKIALQKADIAISRTATARGKAEQADIASVHAREDCETAILCAKAYAAETKKPQPLPKVTEIGQQYVHAKEVQSPQNSRTRNGPLTPSVKVEMRKSPLPVSECPPSTLPPVNTVEIPSSSQAVESRANGSSSNLGERLQHSDIHTSTSNRSSNNLPTNCDINNDSSSFMIPKTDHQTSSNIRSNKLYTSSSTTGDVGPAAVRIGGKSSDGVGSYSFQRVMDDRFEHYKRTPSRQPSTERINLPSSLPEAKQWRPPSAASRSDEASDGIRIRNQANNQEILHPGAMPKRTESLYLKHSSPTQDKKGDTSTNLQRKKSLPDVQNLSGVTKTQGSKEMTREEINILSSTRRDNVRKQLEEIERYKNNPLLYIFSPKFKDWVSRQKLILLVLVVNLSLALMFFKLLT